MPLKGIKPNKIEKRLKMFLYGPAKVGKTTASIQFPNAYMIDTERGSENTQYVDLLNQSGGLYYSSNDFDEVYAEVLALLSEKHDRKTLIIDPITTIYNDLLDKAEKTVGTEYGRHFGEAKKQWKKLYNLLMRLDMNIIITSHQKPVYGDDLKVIGQTFDAFKAMDYMFDLIIRLEKKADSRIGVVVGSRLEGFKINEDFVFSYDEVKKRWGDDNIEAEHKEQKLGSKKSIEKLKHLIEVLKVDPALVDKMIAKAQANSIEEMPQDKVDAFIEWCQKQVK